MKSKAKKRILTLISAVMLCMAAFPLTAYAGGGDEIPEEPTELAVVETTSEQNPFTPAGTGTVIDNATDTDGKEFYTIMTPSENVFYLVIDRQRETENVYFLNAVTENDLLALAEPSDNTGGEVIIPDTTPTQEPAPEPEPEPTPEPEKSGNIGMMVFVVLVVLVGGAAAYYFKIYRPKQQADIGEDYDEYETNDSDPYSEGEDDSPPWDVDSEDGEE